MTHQARKYPVAAFFTCAFGRRPLVVAMSSLLVGSALVPAAQAQYFPAVVKLADLDGNSGFRLDGVAESDRSGNAVSAAGDINGDGVDDLIIGAFLADPDGSINAGSTYVVFGRDGSAFGDFPSTLDLSSLNGSTGFRLDGVVADDFSGFSVSGAGDINGDGTDDLIIGAPFGDPDGDIDAGIGYVVFGRDVSTVGDFPSALNLSSLNGITGFRLDGVAAGGRAGRSVSAAGDINGDGIDDLIISEYRATADGNSYAGRSYVVFGRDVSAEGNFPATLDLSSLDGSNGFRLDGAAAHDFSGGSVSVAGDINNDGIDDLIIGAWAADPGGTNSAGSSYVVFGRNVAAVGKFPASLNLSSLDGITGFRLDGVAQDDDSGRWVSAAGDINGDGIDDLIIGALYADPNGNIDAGSSYVVFGRDVATVGEFPAIFALSSLNGSTGFRIDGAVADDRSGRRASAAGDINDDGIDDVIVGAYRAAPDGTTGAGSSYVILGRNTGFPAAVALSSLNGATGFRLDGAVANDSSGVSVSAAGDVDGDGIDDLLIGASFADPNSNNSAGSSYVVFGRGEFLFADRFEAD